ncbi:LLM class flavin-dependent oxidoreductase [Sphaerisporangium krabiense]|uniref:Alkanesulfonate monooxygenase SsuD/methylene tetrahydromethanopterin reductase-like flavin-dependent oxidoreductase (Luciferase family) n=1 Tax=Sphaerisporangium krabiense TaxID=763782 RepID=A0A7W9DQJ7_9ACTN|nr:LLM class flavin-dependent oxidoreductase [Sphaerisporangium krabiense]MBB5627488.1 alkanesulfonate monooxygenase SsuD/methylene tetrahydromethanopterin reductase-like flavin-dependent oxidoreductase (luciferase family) [Sphaerisporangium krabiense]
MADGRVRWGVTLPLPGGTMRDNAPVIARLPELGYDDVWTGEGGGDMDALTPLAMAAAWQPALRVGTGVVPVQTRGPGVLAQSALSLAQVAEGGVLLGVGASVPAHVTGVNGLPYDASPLTRVRETVRVLKRALPGDRAKVIVGALRPKMLRLAYEEADGAILNLLTAADLPKVIEAGGGPRADRETVVKVFVCPTADAGYARRAGRRFLGWILNQRPYAALYDWLGHGDRLRASREHYARGDFAGAERALPEELVDLLWLHGDPESCRKQIAEFVRPQVTTVLLYVAQGPELAARPGRLPDLLAELLPRDT